MIKNEATKTKGANMIHTRVPTTSKMKIIHCDLKCYKSVYKMQEQASSYKLTDISSYGAVVNMMVNGEEIQLTKKKVTWTDLVFSFFGLPADRKSEDYAKSELMKHGMVIVNRANNN
jgi:hypothetical protein